MWHVELRVNIYITRIAINNNLLSATPALCMRIPDWCLGLTPGKHHEMGLDCTLGIMGDFQSSGRFDSSEWGQGGWVVSSEWQPWLGMSLLFFVPGQLLLLTVLICHTVFFWFGSDYLFIRGLFISSLIFVSFYQPFHDFYPATWKCTCHLNNEGWDEVLHSDWKKKNHYGEPRSFPFYHWNFVFDVSWYEGPKGDHDYNSVFNQSDWSRTKEISRAKQRLQENGSICVKEEGWPGVAKIKDDF